MNRLFIIPVVLLSLIIPQHLFAGEKLLTIIHSNDIHSHFLGASPNIDYSPLTTGEDKTIGGWARIATVIKETKKERSNPVLVVDAGDFLMGSLFHMVTREQAFELRLLRMMGYDAVTLGNHEFDLKPGGLARILTSARDSGQIPQVVFSNAVFSQESSKDDALENIFKQGIVKPYLVLERGGLRIGLFGLLGKDAAEVAPFASPISFEDPIATAQKMVKNFADTDGNGLPNVPDKYRGKLGRNVIDASWNPYKLLKRGTYVTWLAVSALLVGVLLVLGIGWFFMRKIIFKRRFE